MLPLLFGIYMWGYYMRNGGHISRILVLFLFITTINRFASGGRLESGINREITPGVWSLISSILSGVYVVSGTEFWCRRKPLLLLYFQHDINVTDGNE